MPEKQTGVTFEKDVLLWETIQQYSLEPLLTFKSKFPKERRLLYHLERRALLLYLVVDVDTKLAAGGAFWGFVDVTDLTLDTEDGLSGSSGVSGLAPGQWF